MDERAALHLALAAVPGIGPVSAAQLMSAYGSIEALAEGREPKSGWDSLPLDLIRRLDRAFLHESTETSRHDLRTAGWPRALRAAIHAGLTQARAAVKAARDLDLRIVCREDEDYPISLLADVVAPPSVLFISGTLPDACCKSHYELASLAVVGARAASRYSLSFTRDMAAEVADAGIVVVSGLALGVDAAAHEGALETGATVAVLGGGHGRLHPQSHSDLARRIAESGGAVISEWPPDTNPQQGHFPWRNRIVSALSRAVAVIEATERSGALSTVEHALAQGRHILVMPDRPDSQRSNGNLGLLRDGATPLMDASDVLAVFPDVVAAQPPKEPRQEHPILAALAGGGWHTAQVVATHTEMPVPKLLASLTELELKGAIEMQDGRYRLVSSRRKRA